MTSLYTTSPIFPSTAPSTPKTDPKENLCTPPPLKRAQTRVKILSSDSKLPFHLLFPDSRVTETTTPPSTPPAKSNISLPKTPCAKRNRELDPIFVTYNTVIQKLINNTFIYNNKTFFVEALEGGEGNYKQCFLLPSGQEQLISPSKNLASDQEQLPLSYKNKNILIKAFKEEVVEYYEEIPEYVANTIYQYQEAKRLKIECAEILNLDTTNSKEPKLIGNVIIQEKITEPLDLTSWQGDKEINPELIPELVSIKRVFEITVKEYVDFDLLPQNFRHRGDRQIVLIDFREMDSSPIEFQGHLRQALVAWVAGNARVWDYLTSNLDVSEILRDDLIGLGERLFGKRA